MTANVDQRRCIACGLCIGVCPEVFQLDGKGLVQAYKNPVPPKHEKRASQAEKGCPVEAITID